MFSSFEPTMYWQGLSKTAIHTLHSMGCRGLPDRVLDVRCVIGRSIACSLVERGRIDPPHVPWRHVLDAALHTIKKPESGGHPPACPLTYSNPSCRNEVNASAPITTWSSSGIPNRRPASFSFVVTDMSTSLAWWSPLG